MQLCSCISHLFQLFCFPGFVPEAWTLQPSEQQKTAEGKKVMWKLTHTFCLLELTHQATTQWPTTQTVESFLIWRWYVWLHFQRCRWIKAVLGHYNYSHQMTLAPNIQIFPKAKQETEGELYINLYMYDTIDLGGFSTSSSYKSIHKNNITLFCVLEKRVEMEHETNLGIHNETIMLFSMLILCHKMQFKCRSCITKDLNKSGLETISISLASHLSQSRSLDCKRSKLMNALESVEEIHWFLVVKTTLGLLETSTKKYCVLSIGLVILWWRKFEHVWNC